MAPRQATIAGIRVSRFAGPLGPHVAAANVLRGPHPPDVVVDDLAHAVPWASQRISTVPTVVFFRHLHARTLSGQVVWPLAAILKLVERNYGRIYPATTFVTESNQSITDLEHIGVPRTRCVKIPPGVDATRFRPGTPSDPPSVLYFGGLRHYKRPEDAVRAFARTREVAPKAVLTIVGDGPCLPHVTTEVQELDLASQTRILGRVSVAQLESLLASASVNVHCSLAEGWCLSAMEAAACGVPTVAYDAPGIRESVINNVTGLLVESGSIPALAEAIARVLQEREKWREPAIAHARAYQWQTAAEAWERVLTQVALR